MNMSIQNSNKIFTIFKPYGIISNSKSKEVNSLNQILSIDNNSGKSKKNKYKEPKVRNSGPIEISKIVRFFSIAILIFGIFMIGTGSYSIYKDAQEGESKTKPTINITQETPESSELLLKVSHNKSLSKVTYSWNNEEATEIECDGKKSIEQKIEIPSGTNTLTIIATDINGLESKAERQYSIKGNIEINIENVDPKIKITASGNEELSYMTYRWDEEEEVRIDINDTQIEQLIDVPAGQHTLTVIVVDINNKTETKEQEVMGAKKPELKVTTDGSDNFVITASDEQGIKKIEFIINETEKNKIDLDKVLPLEQRKTFEYKYPLHDGENKLEVRVYNENDVVAIEKVKLTK